jgi:predicted RNase H-like HicB family nuclease
MNFGILFEKVTDKDFPAGFFYAHVPSLGLTTHGLGLEGARQAAFDLARLWLAEKKAQGDPLPAPSEILFSTLEVPDDVVQIHRKPGNFFCSAGLSFG